MSSTTKTLQDDGMLKNDKGSLLRGQHQTHSPILMCMPWLIISSICISAQGFDMTILEGSMSEFSIHHEYTISLKAMEAYSLCTKFSAMNDLP